MSNRRLHLIAVSLTLCLTGCVTSEVYVMQSPKTQEVVQCRPGTTGFTLFPLIQAEQENAAARDCAKGYEAAGWKRMNDAEKK